MAREELAAKIRREVPGCELYTEERLNRFFAHRRATAKGVKRRERQALGESFIIHGVLLCLLRRWAVG